MLFNSSIFFLFALIFFIFWPHLRKKAKTRFTYIIIASFIFYGWTNWWYLILLICNRLIDYYLARSIVKWPYFKKRFLTLSILSNLAVLAFFKYPVFIASNIETIFGLFGYHIRITEYIPQFLTIVPIGVSFYTFQSMSYTIDVYRGELRPAKSLRHYLAFLVMFPHLLAGPIVRAKDMLSQLNRSREPSELKIWNGTKLIVLGYFMKVFFADNLAVFVNQAFAGKSTTISTHYWWVIMIAFAYQIYFDFAGYSNIARGLANWMGYDFKQNFNHPYLATSISDFWKRWHISLTSWFRDYVYKPLGGSRVNIWRHHLNIWIVFLLSGLWHGSSWNFVLWGAAHGMFMSIEQFTKWPEKFAHLKGIFSLLALLIVNIEVISAWVLFRATDLNQAATILRAMFSLNFKNISIPLVADLILILLLAMGYELTIVWQNKITNSISLKQRHILEITTVSLIILITFFFSGPSGKFIYFQF